MNFDNIKIFNLRMNIIDLNPLYLSLLIITNESTNVVVISVNKYDIKIKNKIKKTNRLDY